MRHKILVVAPAWVGDLVMAQTLFKVLKIQKPDCTIDVLAADWAVPILNSMPEVRKPILSPTKRGELKLKNRFAMAKKLRAEQYNQAIVLPNSYKSALIPLWAKIQKRTGWLGEMRFGLLNDLRYLNKQTLPLMIQRFAALGFSKSSSIPSDLPWPKLAVQSSHIETTMTQLNLAVESGRPILALCPGAEYGPAKQWPAEHYAALANQKIAEGWVVWLLGSAKDQPITRQITALTQARVVDLAGRTDLGQAIDLLSLAQVIVSNDSGLMHIGAALNKPLVVIYGSSDPRFTPPLTHNKQILTLNLPCSPCFERTCPLEHLKCLKDLHPDQVRMAIDHLCRSEYA